jgi:hypothetical protein
MLLQIQPDIFAVNGQPSDVAHQRGDGRRRVANDTLLSGLSVVSLARNQHQILAIKSILDKASQLWNREYGRDCLSSRKR